MFHHSAYKNPFRARCVVQPAVVEEVVDEYGDVEEIVTPIKRESSRARYLPGERLLRKLNKDRKRSKKHDSHRDDSKPDKQELDLDSIERALANIVKEF